MTLIAGEFTGPVSKFEIGVNKQGKPVVRIEMEVAEGEHKGKRFPYDGKLDEKNIKYTKRAMLAVGWQGKDVRTAAADIAAAAKVVPFSVEIAEWRKDDGTIKQWSSVRQIGYQAQPLGALDGDTASKVNGWFAGVSDANDPLPF